MFGSHSQVHVRNLLTVNRDGLTALYVHIPETNRRLAIIESEYKRQYLNKFLPFWKEILIHLSNSTKKFSRQQNHETLSQFIHDYQLGRAIVFYTEGLAKLLEKSTAHELKTVGHWHEKAEVATCQAWDRLRPVLMRIARKHDVAKNDVLYYLPEEFLQLLQSGKRLSKDVLKQRRYYYVLLLKHGKMFLYTGKKARVIEAKELSKEKIVILRELKGMCASPGRVQGRVRIVNTDAQMHQMKRGEILVSIMTTPRLIAAVKKAAAIVTDEGGITCHAAIVARELKKPCVIGTKIATKVLRDGQQVEVDAIKGIVRIIK